MVQQLYETLGVSKEATPDEVRRAYRQRALKTHPDKQPIGISEKDKQRSEDEFRKVNAAYEVLSDEEKRRVYDRYGEYPAPEVPQEPYADRSYDRRRRPQSHARSRGSGDFFDDRAFNDPFFTPFDAFGSHSRSRAFPGFTDPFALFNEIFGDMDRQLFEDPFFGEPRHAARGPFGHGPFGHGSIFDRMGGSPFGMLPPVNNMFDHMDGPHQAHTMSFSNSSRGSLARGPDGGSQWVSQSRVTRSINGVTESVWKRTDSNGNEHITYSYPDGRERYLINGVEQASGGHADRYLPPPPPYPGPPAPINISRHSSERGSIRQGRNYSPTSPHSPADTKYGYDYEREHRHGHRDHRHQQSQGKHDYLDTRNDPQDHHKKRWWKGER